MQHPSHPQCWCTWTAPDPAVCSPPIQTSGLTDADETYLHCKEQPKTIKYVDKSIIDKWPIKLLFSTQQYFTLKIVVIGVLGHSAVKKSPSEVVHSILLVFHSLSDYLSVEVVMKTVVQMRFNWQRLIKKLLKEVLTYKEKCKVCEDYGKEERKKKQMRSFIAWKLDYTFLEPWHIMTQQPSSSWRGRLAFPTICSTS